MSELRDKATRLLLKSAWEMADDNEDELSAVFDGQHGFIDDFTPARDGHLGGCRLYAQYAA